MYEAIEEFGLIYIGLTMYQPRESLLKKAMDRTSKSLDPHRKLRDIHGCSLMMENWTCQKHRCVMNMCVHSSGGVSFYN